MQCQTNVQYSRWEYLEITGIPSSASDKDLGEVVSKMINKDGVEINAGDITDCHRVDKIQ